MIAKHASKLVFLFVLFGLAASVYGLEHHFSKSGGGACNITAVISCDLVNRGPYSEILGFPVAGIGLIGYLMIGIVAYWYLKESDELCKHLLLGLCAGGVAFSLYLTYLEIFVIHGVCPICLSSLFSIIGAGLSAVLMTRKAPAVQSPASHSA